MGKIFPLSSCVFILIHEARPHLHLLDQCCSFQFYVFAMLGQAILFLLTSQLVITKGKFNKRNRGNTFCVWSWLIDKRLLDKELRGKCTKNS